MDTPEHIAVLAQWELDVAAAQAGTLTNAQGDLIPLGGPDMSRGEWDALISGEAVIAEAEAAGWEMPVPEPDTIMGISIPVDPDVSDDFSSIGSSEFETTPRGVFFDRDSVLETSLPETQALVSGPAAGVGIGLALFGLLILNRR